MKKDFFTFREYMKKEDDMLTASMEDYLEMIFRLSNEVGYTRINELADALHIQPPSATKMVRKLAEIGAVNYEKYGLITLKDKGKEMGKSLLERHQIIEDFLKLLGVSENLLEETEKIEHTISNQTLRCIVEYVNFLKHNPEIINDFEIYKKIKYTSKC